FPFFFFGGPFLFLGRLSDLLRHGRLFSLLCRDRFLLFRAFFLRSRFFFFLSFLWLRGFRLRLRGRESNFQIVVKDRARRRIFRGEGLLPRAPSPVNGVPNIRGMRWKKSEIARCCAGVHFFQ